MDMKPLAPEIIADALQDRIAPSSGRLLSSSPIATYDFKLEAKRIVDALELKGATMTLVCALREAYAAGAHNAEAKYHELLLSVGNKHQGESRHETALRYIRQAEQSHGPASSAEGGKSNG